MAKKKQKKPRTFHRKPTVKNMAPKVPFTQGLKKGFTIPEGMSN